MYSPALFLTYKRRNMKKTEKLLQVFLITLIAILTLSVGVVTSRANETEAKYTGTYDTGYVRTLWAYCYNTSLQKRMHPGQATPYCDCIVDTIRTNHTKETLEGLTGRIELFKRYANECGIKLFGPAPTSLGETLTHARKLPIGANRWLQSQYFGQYLTKPVLPRFDEG